MRAIPTLLCPLNALLWPFNWQVLEGFLSEHLTKLQIAPQRHEEAHTSCQTAMHIPFQASAVVSS